MKIPYLYVFDEDTGQLETYVDMILERLIFGEGTNVESYHFFAIDNVKKLRFEILERSNQVFYNPDKHRYYIWTREPDKTNALKRIYLFVLEKIDEICKMYDDDICGLKKAMDKLGEIVDIEE